MAEPARLPEEDRPDIHPDIPELRASEGIGGRRRGDHSGRDSTGSPGGRRRGDHPDSGSSSAGQRRRGDNESSVSEKERAVSPSKLDDAESQQDDFYNDGGNPRTGNRRRFLKKYWKRAAGGGAIGIGTLGVVLFSSISQGPLQLIHLDEILQKPSFGSNQDSKIGLNQVFRYYRSGNPGETRVGEISSRIVGKTLADLKDVGIEFQRDSFDHIKSATFDTGKLQKNWPELEGMSDAQRQAFLSEKMGIPESELVRIGTGKNVNGTKFAFNNRDGGVKATRLLTKNSLAALENGKVLTSIKFRSMAKFFNVSSLFHPIERAKATVQKKSITKADRKQAAIDEAERQKNLEKPTLEKAAPAEGRLRDKLTGKNLAASALLLTAGMCLVRDIADNVVAVNFGSIVMPASLQAVDKQATGEQAKSGQDIDAGQAGGVVDGFTDKNGKTIWTGKALQALSGSPQTGEEIPHDYQQAFAGATSAQGIKNYLGGGGFGDVACSTPGQIVQGVIGVAIIVSGFFDAGASWGAKAAQVGAEGANAVASAGVIALIQSQSTRLLANKAIVPQVLSGPLGGNLLAYGARSAANMSARASGGVALGAQGAAALAQQQQQEDQQQFRSKSFFARIFNIKDYRSLTGRLADSLSPSISQNFASITTSFMNIGSWLPHTFSAVLPRAQAVDKYDWTFPLVGIPPEIWNDSQMQDPYDNNNKMAALLDGSDGQSYIDKAEKCFGKDDNDELISKSSGVWDVMAPSEPVNPNSDEYMNAHCDDLSDPNWKRTILFVFSTLNMKALDCYQGSEQSCQDLGIENSSGSGGGSAPSTEAGATIDMDHLYDSSVNVACAQNTKDLGIQDGYTQGKKVKIRICAVSNMASSGEESQGNYGVSGADGKAVVNSRVSGAVYAMVAAAKADDTTLSATSAFRTMAHQQALCPCDGVSVAVPGTSNHQMGLAIDFDGLPSTPAPGSGPVWNWLAKNAAKFGYKNYPHEAWHWSPTGS
jgi:hypothetical protein